MGGVMKPLASSSVFTDMIGKVAHIPILGVLTGALMTLVVQSSSATIAVRMITKELEDICMDVKKMLPTLQNSIQDNSITYLNQVKDSCELVEKRNDDMMQYMAALFSTGSLTEEQAGYVSDMMLVMENVEHIERRCMEIADCVQRKIEKKYKYTSDAAEDLEKSIRSVSQMFNTVLEYLQGRRENPSEELSQQRNRLMKQRNKMRKNNNKRMQEHKCQKENGMLFNRTIFCLERITHDCMNLLENDISQFQLEEV